MNIKVTPDELKNQANLVSEDIKNINKHWRVIVDKIERSKSYWEGDASISHIRIYKDISEDMGKVIKKLENNPQKLLRMAGIYEETEQEIVAESEKLPTDLF